MSKFLRSQYFSADNGSEAGGNPGADGKETESGGGDDKSFNQEEVNRIVADRLARENKKYEGYDDMKTQLAELLAEKQKREQDEMTESEKVAAEMQAAVQRAEAAEQERDQALQSANKRMINAEFKQVATALNVRPDAIADALLLADLSSVSVDAEGNVIGVDSAVKALIEAKPFLSAPPKKPEAIGGPSGGGQQLGDKTKEQQLAEAAAKVQKNPTGPALAEYMKLKRELGF